MYVNVLAKELWYCRDCERLSDAELMFVALKEDKMLKKRYAVYDFDGKGTPEMMRLPFRYTSLFSRILCAYCHVNSYIYIYRCVEVTGSSSKPKSHQQVAVSTILSNTARGVGIAHCFERCQIARNRVCSSMFFLSDCLFGKP